MCLRSNSTIEIQPPQSRSSTDWHRATPSSSNIDKKHPISYTNPDHHQTRFLAINSRTSSMSSYQPNPKIYQIENQKNSHLNQRLHHCVEITVSRNPIPKLLDPLESKQTPTLGQSFTMSNRPNSFINQRTLSTEDKSNPFSPKLNPNISIEIRPNPFPSNNFPNCLQKSNSDQSFSNLSDFECCQSRS